MKTFNFPVRITCLQHFSLVQVTQFLRVLSMMHCETYKQRLPVCVYSQSMAHVVHNVHEYNNTVHSHLNCIHVISFSGHANIHLMEDDCEL